MSLRVRQAYALGVIYSHSGVAFASQTAPTVIESLRRNAAVRGYATESALASKRKGAASAKSTHKSTAVASASTPKVPTKVVARAGRKASGAPAMAEVKTMRKSATKLEPGTTQEDTSQVSKGPIPNNLEMEKLNQTTAKAASPAAPTLSDDEMQLKQLEMIQLMAQAMPSADPFGQPVTQSLDIILPQPAGLKHLREYGSIKAWWKQFWQNRLNGGKNATSLLYLASDDAIPGRKMAKVPWYKSFNWLFKALRTTSVKEDAWLAPFRRTALETYRALNTAVASRDVKKIREFTTSAYRDEALHLSKKRPSGLVFKWRLDREVSPTQVLSLRVTDGFLGKGQPKFGTKFLVHALIKFDTEQSLECYGQNGEVLHEPAPGAVKHKNGTIAAKPKRVTEYLVMEKRMWYDSPWVFREQRWEVPHRKVERP